MRTGTCNTWTALIRNYSASAGNAGGTYVRVFSDGSTTAQIDATLRRDGATLKNASVMAHLHVGACFEHNENGHPDFDQRGVRESASGALWTHPTSEDGEIKPFHGDTAIFITPGYRFRAVDVLMTNFHLPKSTLFMLVSAFAGTATMKAAYAHAVADGYRFYSYGDGSLLFRD